MSSLIEMLLSLLAVKINSKKYRYSIAFLKGLLLTMLGSFYVLGVKLLNGGFKEGDVVNILLKFFIVGCVVGILLIIIEYFWGD